MSRLEPYWTRKATRLSPEALQSILSICRMSRCQPRVLLSKAVRSYPETGSFLRLIDVQAAKQRPAHAFGDILAIVWQVHSLKVLLASDYTTMRDGRIAGFPGSRVTGQFTFHRWPLQARVEVLGKVVKRGCHGKSYVH